VNDYRERLEIAGFLKAFERARSAGNAEAMRTVLERANFTSLEIDSVLWSKGGNVASAPTSQERKKRVQDAIIGRIGVAVLSGGILGGVFVWWSSGYDGGRRDNMKRMMADYRTPKEAYYRPFIWGFSIGAVVGLITGTLAYDPTSKERAAKL